MPEQPPTAQFNAAIASTERLHKLLLECNFYSKGVENNYPDRYNNILLWRSSVDALFREIAAKLTDDEYKHIETLFQDLAKVKLQNVSIKANRAYTYNDERGFYTFKTKLRNIEIQLRRLADRRGLLIPNKESMDGAIADME